MFPFSGNEYNPLSFRDSHQVPLQVQDLQRGTVIDLKDGIVGDLFMLCDLPFHVFFDDLPDFVHPLNYEHIGIPRSYLGPYPFSCRNVLYFA